MKFDVKAIARNRGDAMEIDAVSTSGQLELAFPGFVFDRGSPVTLKGTIQNAGHGMLVLSGETTAGYEASCARCLAPIQRALRVRIKETFRSTQRYPGERSPEYEEETDEESYEYDGLTVDATDALRENLLTALPIRELCREDCAGFCPTCGADRNLGPCGCPDPDDADKHPFGRLKDLL